MELKVIFPTRLWVACALVSLAFTAGANPPEGPGFDKAAEYAGVAFDKDAALEKRAATHAWLMSEAVQRGQGAPISANVSKEEMAAIDEAPPGMLPERVGLTKPLAVPIDFRDVTAGQLNGRALSRPNGAMAGTSDDGYVYTMTLSSAGATALRVHFTGFRMPDNASVYLYTENGQVFGPYTGLGPLGDGEFWSHTLMGDTVYLQVRHVGRVSGEDLRGTRFNVAGLGHVRPRWLGFCNGNAECVQNADCPGTASAVTGARDAVAHMQWISGPFIFICTGGLVADTDGSSTIPYFLSANHCIRRGREARNLENFFQFKAPCGTSGNCDDVIDTRNNHPQDLRTLGARIVHTASNTDHTLFELREPAPTGSAFLGWDSAPVADTNAVDLFRISHPNGAPQAYSAHRVDTSAPTCQSWPRGDRIYSRDTYGATEGGSSGSPVVNSAGQIVGQLSGACGFNVGDQCDNVLNATVDGAFAAYFSEVAEFLDPASGGGGGGGGGGLPAGDSCTADSDCASNKCKGRPGAKICK